MTFARSEGRSMSSIRLMIWRAITGSLFSIEMPTHESNSRTRTRSTESSGQSSDALGPALSSMISGGVDGTRTRFRPLLQQCDAVPFFV